MVYSEELLVQIAKRENNKKRAYLVLNKFQGKHLPAAPHQSIAMFDALSNLVKEQFMGKRLLVIGFAETATAIGVHVAIQNAEHYMQTTREQLPEVEYIYFAEEHSHAVEQKVVKTDIDKVIDQVDTILFVEDEITTGNTILNSVNAFRNYYSEYHIQYSVASLLNGMDVQAIEQFKQKGITFHYLVKTDQSQYEKKALQYQKFEPEHCIDTCEIKDRCCYQYHSGLDARRLINTRAYQNECIGLCEKALPIVENAKDVLVLGTEEFMYPGLFIANQIEQSGVHVTFHATTRSPIAASKEEQYPIQNRYRLKSLYEDDRVTYLYELRKYDHVLIITDANCEQNVGLGILIETLKSCGNQKIDVMEWRNR